jgi:heat shock protein HslJ
MVNREFVTDSPQINKELEMKIFRVIAVLSVLTIIVSACSPGNPADQIDLEGTSWLLTAFNLNNPIEGSQVTMTFNEGLVTGNAGCNSYSSAYQVDGETIAFGPIVQTEMACMEPTGVMEQERDFLEILGAAQSIELADGLLTIVAENGQTLTYQPFPDNLSSPDSQVDNQTSVSQTNPTDEPAPTQPVISFEPPVGFKEYRDSQTGITIYIPEEWTIQNQSIVEGEYAIFSSYPPDKYIGGGARQPGDTKCDLNLNPSANSADDLIQQWETSAITKIVSEEDIVLNSGNSGIVFIIDSMGRSTTLATEIDNNLVTFTCWGESDLFDEIAVTLH